MTGVLNFYEIKVRRCANVSKMIWGLYVILSYEPTCDADSFRLSLNIVLWDGLIVVCIDASNEFQTNVISDPKKRGYITIPAMYLERSRARFPNHLLEKCTNNKELAIQSLRNIQGAKDVGFKWYQLLVKIFTALEWKTNSTYKGV